MKKKLRILFLMLSFLFAGCSAKLAEEESSFEGKGIHYNFQLPSTWNTTNDFQTVYSQQAVFGATDTKSNSSLFITVERKDKVELTNFGENMRKEVASLYGYKKADDVYMKEFKLKGKKAYKYTVKTKFAKRTVWLHLYYIETESGMVRFDFYSADDGQYEKRAEIIDRSVRSLEEGKDLGEETSEDEEDSEIVFENDTVTLKLVGIMQIDGEDAKQLAALRYTITNKGAATISANFWEEQIQVKQQEEHLENGQLPKDTAVLDLSKLIGRKKEIIATNETVEAVSLYELKDMSNLKLIPSKKLFSETKSVYIPLTSEGERP